MWMVCIYIILYVCVCDKDYLYQINVFSCLCMCACAQLKCRYAYVLHKYIFFCFVFILFIYYCIYMCVFKYDCMCKFLCNWIVYAFVIFEHTCNFVSRAVFRLNRKKGLDLCIQTLFLFIFLKWKERPCVFLCIYFGLKVCKKVKNRLSCSLWGYFH